MYKGHFEIIDPLPPPPNENGMFNHQLETQLSWGVHYGGRILL